jgi:hypothetical protein
MLWLPESPRWLLLSGAPPSAATAALKKAKGRSADDAAIKVRAGGRILLGMPPMGVLVCAK